MLKRIFPLLLSLAILALGISPIQAQSGISYPPETEVLRGIIQILGTADHPEFWKYELAAAPFGTQNWFNIGVSETPVFNGVLGRWNTNTVADGTYTLRLRLVKRDGNYDEFQVQRALVSNSGPTPTPTVDETAITPTPTVTPTPKPATATPVVLTPDIPTPTPSPDDTPTPGDGVTPGAEDGGDGSDSLASLGERTLEAFGRGARTVLIVFLIVGFFFAVKYLLTWLYYRYLVR